MTAPDKTPCTACGGEIGDVFHVTRPYPVHSCLLLDSAQEAAAFPKGSVRLAACGTCGTITNVDFDARWSAYSPHYEDQQSFSPTFQAFSKRLADEFVERHRLRGCTVVDIGCSKGDFLRQLGEAGVARGIGIDPSALDGRVAPAGGTVLEFVQSYYGREHLALPADAITCRHTLEHIWNVGETLRLVREHANQAGARTVLIEVPDMARVLRDCAFEDIYYEHCSYFTPGALARVLRAAGFGVCDIWLDFGDQYLIAEATPQPDDGTEFDIEEPIEETLELVARFAEQYPRTLAAWRSRLAQIRSSDKLLAIWGSGSKCIAVVHELGLEEQVATIVDINPFREGKYAPGLSQPIALPHALKERPPDVVWVMNAIYKAEIAEMLRRMGLHPTLMVLGEDDCGIEPVDAIPVALRAGTP